MWNEENISEILHMKEEAKKFAQENIAIRIEAKRITLQTQWDQDLEDFELARQKLIIKLDKEAKIRVAKKKKRGKGKKKAK